MWDTMLVERHLYAGYYTQTFGLKDLARRYLNLLVEKETRERFEDASEMDQQMAEYAGLDSWITVRVAQEQARIEGEGMVDFRSYHEANEPAIWAVLDMPPIRVDPDAWLKLAKRLGDEGRKLQEFVGINVRSPKQVKAFVESRIGREVRDTSKETLEFLAGDAQDEDDGGLIELKRIMRARSLLMMEATYGESFLETMTPGGYILPGWKVDGADTGRTACSDPNFQNVPVRDMPEFRNVVIPSDGGIFIVSDASQQEIRVGAVATMDPILLSMVRSGASVYMKVAEARYGEKITKKDPRYDQIKMVTLGTFYGATPSTIATRERIPKAQAKDLQDWMFQTFKALPPWMQKQRQKAYDKGYVETLLGRRLWVNPHDRQWENNAVNSIIQGCLPSTTRILTKGGWVPIGTFQSGDEVWTGEAWATAEKLERGEAPRVRLHLSDGRTFDCDDRHIMLVKGGVWPEWCHVSSLVGRELVRCKGIEWGEQIGDVEDWYWAGRWIGDGSFSGVTWQLVFGSNETDDIAKFEAWLVAREGTLRGGTNSKRGWSRCDKRPSSNAVQFIGGTKAGVEMWEGLGLRREWRSKTKRIPDVVFTLDLARRKAFFEGYAGADGYKRNGHAMWKLTSVNRPLLEDMLRLLQTMGMSGRIGKHIKNRWGGWYELGVHKGEAPLVVERVEVFGVEAMFTLSVQSERHSFSSEGLISKNTAAELTKIALVLMHKELPLAGLPFGISLQIHDELDGDFPKGTEEKAKEVMREAWIEAGRRVIPEVPFVAEFAVGSSWGCKR